MLTGRDIVCFASSPWVSPLKLNVHHVMERLSHINRVLYVEPLSMRFPSTSRADLSKVLARVKAAAIGTRRVSDSLHVISPLLIPAPQFPSVRRLNRVLLIPVLRTAMRKLGFDEPVVWAFVPTAADLLGRLGERLVVYHCVDHYAANPGVNAAVVGQLERRMLQRADLAITTSPALFESKRSRNPWTYYLPNAADVDHFRSALRGQIAIPPDLLHIPRPLVGFVGAISAYKVDLSLLAFCAAHLPNASFVLIGPIGLGGARTDITTLQRMRNVYVLGPREYDRLPYYVRALDVCLIPYRSNATTRHVFPMKFFEYLSLEKPVVSTDLPALDEYAELCYVAKNRDEFVEAIERGLKEQDARVLADRASAASRHSWSVRIEQISALVEDALRRGRES